MATADSQLFEDTFTITAIDSAKYDRVARLSCSGVEDEVVATLDINTELFPCVINEQLNCVLASTLSLDGTKDDKGWRDISRGGPGGETTLADMFDYVCHGKVYKFEEAGDEVINAYISFGGLLMAITGPFKKLTPLRVDYLYLLLKK